MAHSTEKNAWYGINFNCIPGHKEISPYLAQSKMKADRGLIPPNGLHFLHDHFDRDSIGLITFTHGKEGEKIVCQSERSKNSGLPDKVRYALRLHR